MTQSHQDFSPLLFRILNQIRQLVDLVFPFFYLHIVDRISRDKLRNDKRKLFKSLSLEKSKDPKLQKMTAVRVVEVGIGGGANFEFYPASARLIAVDRNESFKKYLVQNIKKYGITVEKLVYAGAEDMSEIRDGTVDVVISSFMLCSVDSPQKTLQEIRRILAKGGKYYFFEHGRRGSFWMDWFQFLFRPFWFAMNAGCVWDRNIEEILNAGGFVKLNITQSFFPLWFQVALPCFTFYYGTATKA